VPLRVAVGLACALSVVLATTVAGAAWPEPWSDDDPAGPPARLAVGDYGFRGSAEYRAQGTYVNPLDLSSETYYRSFWLQHRLRLDGAVDYQETIKITTSVDALDGVLWGDNGNLGTDPEPSNGAHVNTNNVNVSQLCMTLDSGANPVDPHSYHYGFCPANVINVRRLYGDVVLPVGLLRVGRQAFTEGAGVAVNDGDGRRNRFGVSDRGNSADRILFATKPLEAFKHKDLRDRSENNGFFLILAYDQLVIDEPQLLGFNLHEVIAAARYLAPDLHGVKDLELRLFYTYRWDGHFGTNVDAFGGRAVARFGNWFAGIDATGVLGGTTEVSDAFHLITNDPAVSQAIRQLGARAVIRYDQPKWTAYLEGDYASGSSVTSPRTRTSACSSSSRCSPTRPRARRRRRRRSSTASTRRRFRSNRSPRTARSPTPSCSSLSSTCTPWTTCSFARASCSRGRRPRCSIPSLRRSGGRRGPTRTSS
jgi:hypothetical protein